MEKNTFAVEVTFKICFLIVVSIIHALNILLEYIERRHIFQNSRVIWGCFFQFIAEKKWNDGFCDNSDILLEELIF